MLEFNNYFSYCVDENNAITFLIDGKKKNNSFYNYLVRKILSQLEVKDHVYPIGPSLLVYDTREIISPLWNDTDCFILDEIINISKNKEKNIYKTFTMEYILKLKHSVKYQYATK